MRILAWTPLLEELNRLEDVFDGGNLELLDATDPDSLVVRAIAEKPDLVLLDEEMPGGPIPVVRRLRSNASSGPAIRFIVRTNASARPPADGVLAVPRGDGNVALYSAMNRLLQIPIRANARAFTLIEARGRAAGKRMLEGWVVDVSIGGARIRTTHTMRMGELVTLAFTLSPADPLLIAGGRVVRDAGEEHGMRFYGLEFSDLTGADRNVISRFVDRALRLSSSVVTRSAPARPVAAPALVGA